MGGTLPPSSTENDDQAYLFDQLDGNISILSEISSQNEHGYSSPPSLIPTQVGYRPTKVIYERPLKCRKIIRRDNKSVQALTLPKMTNYNMRALFSKIENFSIDMLERESDLSFLTEVWQKKENKKHQFKIEEMFQLKGIKYISTPRPGAQRGGGAAIAIREDKFTISKLNIPLPRSVEVVWGLLKPKVVTGIISTIIVCCFYSPPDRVKTACCWTT